MLRARFGQSRLPLTFLCCAHQSRTPIGSHPVAGPYHACALSSNQRHAHFAPTPRPTHVSRHSHDRSRGYRPAVPTPAVVRHLRQTAHKLCSYAATAKGQHLAKPRSLTANLQVVARPPQHPRYHKRAHRRDNHSTLTLHHLMLRLLRSPPRWPLALIRWLLSLIRELLAPPRRSLHRGMHRYTRLLLGACAAQLRRIAALAHRGDPRRTCRQSLRACATSIQSASRAPHA